MRLISIIEGRCWFYEGWDHKAHILVCQYETPRRSNALRDGRSLNIILIHRLIYDHGISIDSCVGQFGYWFFCQQRMSNWEKRRPQRVPSLGTTWTLNSTKSTVNLLGKMCPMAILEHILRFILTTTIEQNPLMWEQKTFWIHLGLILPKVE